MRKTMKKQPSDPSLDWLSFKDRFERFVKKMSFGEIELSDDGLAALTQSSVWSKTNDTCNFKSNSSTCQAKKYRMSHPKLIFETLLGEGSIKDKKATPPTIARIDLSFSKIEKEASGEELPTFNKLRTIFSVIFVFKSKDTETEVYSDTLVNGISKEVDSMILSPDLVGSAICLFANTFEKTVIKRSVPSNTNLPQHNNSR